MPTIAELEARAEQFRQELAELRVHVTAPHMSLVYPANQSATPPPATEPAKPLRLDLGCGKNKREGFLGVDVLDFPGVDVKCNIGLDKWPWPDSSVDEVHCSHTVEHLRCSPEWPERVHFVNELWRVLKPGAKATIIVPHWNSCRHWGDYTHREPVSEMWPLYLNKKWRESDAPHNVLYTCDFDCTTPGYSGHPELQFKSEDFKLFALRWYREAAQDMIFTLICARKP